jgi:hypothetical protein
MTATSMPTLPSSPPWRPPPDRSGDTTRSGRDGSARHEPAAELCLVLVTVAVIVGFGRVFTGIAFAGPLLTVAVATHGGRA